MTRLMHLTHAELDRSHSRTLTRRLRQAQRPKEQLRRERMRRGTALDEHPATRTSLRFVQEHDTTRTWSLVEEDASSLHLFPLSSHLITFFPLFSCLQRGLAALRFASGVKEKSARASCVSLTHSFLHILLPISNLQRGLAALRPASGVKKKSARPSENSVFRLKNAGGEYPDSPVRG